jgi:hypothetical protein
VKQRSPETRLVPMLMPLLSGDAARAVAGRLGIALPDALLARLDQDGERAGWSVFEESLARLHQSPLADGVAVMTREMDPPLSVTGRVTRILERVRA